MTIDEIAARLDLAGIPSPRFDALCLAEFATGRSRATLLSERNADISSPVLEEVVRRRENREPLQYIIGRWEFMGVPFFVSPSCLIPRADTEILAEAVIKALPVGGALLDMCTGSGCVAVAAAYHRPDVRAVGADLSPEAISTAVENAKLNGVDGRVSFVVRDVREPWDGDEKFDVVSANPPYVSDKEMNSLPPELSFEPRMALTDGEDGFSLIRAFVRFALGAVKDGGAVAVEHGSEQGEGARDIFKEYGLSPRTVRDLGGRERVTIAKV